jgi:two-component system chemotaxis response regulator CheB
MEATQAEMRDIVVIGGSSGALKSLRTILRGLKPDLPAALLVVLHVGEGSQLARVLENGASIPVTPAQSGQRIKPGHAYVAIPGCHLLLHDQHILLRRGPRENLSRPAVDALFRSAAASRGGRVIGVLLSGALSDGAAGLRAVQRCGGLAIVQDPADAAVPDMPRNALRHMDVDHTAKAGDIADLLNRLSGSPAAPTPEIPLDIRLETAIAAQELTDMRADDALGVPSRFTCPECSGALWEIEDGPLLRFRCHVGHAFGAEDLESSQDNEAERLLDMLLRSHQERAALAGRMADHAHIRGRLALADQLRARALDYGKDVELLKVLRQTMGAGSAVTPVAEGKIIAAHAKQDNKAR